MVKKFITLLLIVTLPSVVSDDWVFFKKTYKKVYHNLSEELYRMKIYLKNKHMIEKHNKKYRKGLVSFHLRMNHYGDMMNHEFKARLTTMNETHLKKVIEPIPFKLINLTEPQTVDWRQKGATTSVKSQGTCGSCWAFSTTGALEGQGFIKKGRLITLSEQNLLDCSAKYGNEGCDGGLIINSLEYVIENGGVDTNESYPYEGKVGPCRFNATNVGISAKGYVELPKGNEAALKNAVAHIGPISAGIHAHGQIFQFYAGGIYSDPKCNPDDVNHGILVSGYGTEGGNDFWLIKNSMSEAWGERGYMKLVRNQTNHCGIATSPAYPVIS